MSECRGVRRPGLPVGLRRVEQGGAPAAVWTGGGGPGPGWGDVMRVAQTGAVFLKWF